MSRGIEGLECVSTAVTPVGEWEFHDGPLTGVCDLEGIGRAAYVVDGFDDVLKGVSRLYRVYREWDGEVMEPKGEAFGFIRESQFVRYRSDGAADGGVSL